MMERAIVLEVRARMRGGEVLMRPCAVGARSSESWQGHAQGQHGARAEKHSTPGQDRTGDLQRVRLTS